MPMKILIILLVVSSTIANAFAQTPTTAIRKLGPAPVFFVDSIEVTPIQLQTIDANSISILTIYYNETAVKQLGERAKDGAVYSETISFARKRYLRNLSAYSTEYASLVANGDSQVQYILDDKVLSKDIESKLSAIDRSLIISLKLIDAKELQKKHDIRNKEVGVIIRTLNSK